MASMEVLLHDMEQTLGKPVALPVPDNAIPAQSYREQLAAEEAFSDQVDISTLDPLKGKAREASFDSNYGSDTEADTVDIDLERAATSCTSTSPTLSATATSPLTKDLSTISLDEVAEQWRKAQTQQADTTTALKATSTPNEKLDKLDRRNVSKDIASTVHTEFHGLEARC